MHGTPQPLVGMAAPNVETATRSLARGPTAGRGASAHTPGRGPRTGGSTLVASSGHAPGGAAERRRPATTGEQVAGLPGWVTGRSHRAQWRQGDGLDILGYHSPHARQVWKQKGTRVAPMSRMGRRAPVRRAATVDPLCSTGTLPTRPKRECRCELSGGGGMQSSAPCRDFRCNRGWLPRLRRYYRRNG